MPEALIVKLDDLLDLMQPGKADEVYSDDYFSRRKAVLKPGEGINVNVILDYVNEFKTGIAYLSFSTEQPRNLVFREKNIKKTSHGYFIKLDGKLLWLPTDPVFREYLDRGNIKKQEKAAFQLTEQGQYLELSFESSCGLPIEFPVVIIDENIEGFAESLDSPTHLEQRKVKLYKFFDYAGIGDAWDYLVNASVYHASFSGSGLRWQCQQTADVLYQYLVYLAAQTGSKIYHVLSSIVAYSVMLSLPEDGRWRHGHWTDMMETHTRHQIDGIHLLLSYYEATKRDVFLQKACCAMDYLIQIADKMDGEKIWLLHDTLELENNCSNLRYKNNLTTTAFGKSISNTLCLNTHIWNLAVLHRLDEAQPNRKYRADFDKGMASLKEVVQASPSQLLYSIIYRLCDVLTAIALKTGKKPFRGLHEHYCKFIKKHVLPKLKKNSPRICMPNGFIERDLTHSYMSNLYHLVTLKDFLFLYSQCPVDWLRETIEKSIAYSLEKGFVKYFAKNDIRAAIFIDILLLYTSLIDDSYIHLIAEYMNYFGKIGLDLSADVISHNMVINSRLTVKTDNPELIVLTCGPGNYLQAIIVNSGNNAQRATVDISGNFSADEIEIVDSNNKKMPAGKKVILPGQSYLKLVSLSDLKI